MPAPKRDQHSPPVFQTVTPASLGQLRVLHLGDLELQIDAHRLRVAGKLVHLAPWEFELLRNLMDNAGRVATRRELLDNVWESGHSDSGKTLDVHIARLRRRINTPGQPDRIRTVRGLGYIFDLPDPS
jgi:two-component system phosphate regulon response regulator PhoB